MMKIAIPESLTKDHGGDRALAIGASWAETFEIHGGLTRHSTVLDIGCGPGRMAIGVGERFGFHNPLYLGFDIRKQDIDWCTANITNNHSNFRFLHLDVRNGHYNPGGKIDPAEVRFPADDGAFNFIFATSVFTHMRTKEMLVYLNESRRCLSPDGKFFATFFCLEDHYQGQMAADRDFSKRLDAHCYTARPKNPEDAIGYSTDFVMESFKEIGFRTRFFRGGWTGIETPTGRHNQDYIVATH
jgi:SAM-dependent methyltransferase